MGLLVDTSVFVRLERQSIDLTVLDTGVPKVTSVIVLSELLMGVAIAPSARLRDRRADFAALVERDLKLSISTSRRQRYSPQ